MKKSTFFNQLSVFYAHNVSRFAFGLGICLGILQTSEAQEVVLTQKLLNSLGASEDDQMGYSVSIDNGIAVVGVTCSDHGNIGAGISLDICNAGPNRGAIYIFYKDQGGTDNWGLVKKIINGTGTNDATQTFINLNGNDGDVFGYMVAVSEDVILVGTPNDDHVGSNRGAVYIFGKDQGGADNWGLVRKVINGSGINTSTETYVNIASADENGFGWGVALSGNTAVVSAPQDSQGGTFFGAIYILEKDQGGADAWSAVRKIINGSGTDNATQTFINIGSGSGILGDFFGWSIAISGDNLITGTSWDSQGGTLRGAAYILHRNQGGANHWGLVKKIINGSGTNDTQENFINLSTVIGSAFGWSVAISDQIALVGSPYEGSFLGADAEGAVFVFAKDQGGIDQWGLVKKIINQSGTNTTTQSYIGTSSGDLQFGYSVALADNTVLVGAPFDDQGGTNRGAVYMFEKDEGGTDQWGLVKKIVNGSGTNNLSRLFISENSSNNDEFGFSVAMWQDVYGIGAPFNRDGGISSGGVYILSKQLIPTPITFLMDFHATRLDIKTVKLTWQSAWNEDQTGFAIEQSENAEDFMQIAFVDASRSDAQSMSEYQYILQNTEAAYYRLRQIEKSGDFYYSPVQFVSESESNQLVKVYPNPSTEKVRLLADSEISKQNLKITLFSQNGQFIWKGEGKPATLEDKLNQQLSSVSAGLYFLEIQYSTGNQMQKIIRY